MKKPVVFAALLTFLVLSFIMFGDRVPDMATLKANLEDMKAWRDQAPLQSAVLFFLAYFAVTAFSLPAGTLMTLTAGCLFGFLEGLVIVSFASSIGALVSFLAARYFLRDSVRSRFGEWFNGIYGGIARDGAYYLFTLRLIPIFPFFAINLVMGLTPLPAWTFYWVSQIGMLAGSAVYVNAGTQIAGLDSLSGILSPSLLASFALIGLFPWFAKAVVAYGRRRTESQ